MRIIITGANGFIGKNLVAELKNRKYTDLYLFDHEQSLDELAEECKKADFIFHLAGVNRPLDQSEFKSGNAGLTQDLIGFLVKANNLCPILLSSSIQAELDNPYGQSKKEAEDLILNYGNTASTPVFVYRLANVFGKWSRPNYNTVVATFCHNISRELPITINNPEAQIRLVYIDDIIDEWINVMESKAPRKLGNYCIVLPEHVISLQKLADTLYGFKKNREDFMVPDIYDPLTKKLYSTYLSFLPEDQFAYPLKMNIDPRGSFTEFLKTTDRGQVSVNVAKPGITKGNHWHHTKNEKFLVVSGEAVIRFRKIGTSDIIEYKVNGDKLEVVDIPCGYTHNIQNIGTTDLVTLMWANELLDPNKPDTYFLEV